MRFKYLTMLRYSPRGKSKSARNSVGLMGLCKNGNISFGENLVKGILDYKKKDYFNNSTLIPVPGSSPLVIGALCPTKVLTEVLYNNDIGNGVSECLQRTIAIPKSSSQYHAPTRNKVQDHLGSLRVNSLIIDTPTIILIDDVLTLGRTAMACALLLKESYPDKEIKVFCPFRTRSKDTDTLIDIKEGEMKYINNDVKLPD